MIGIAIVTHGRLAEELITTLEHISGKQELILPISIFPEDDVEKKRGEMMEKVASLNNGKGVIVFTDMFGGTPSNLAISLLKTGEIEIIAGVNIPMLVRLAQERQRVGITEAVSLTIEAGKKYMSSASQF